MAKQAFDEAGQRKLKFVSVDSEGYFDGAEVGYQRVDDMTVLERKNVPLSPDSNSFLVYVYDFNTKIMLTIIEQNDEIKSTTVKPFSEVEGREAIMDAHRALSSKKLKGTPPPLDEIFPNDPLIGKRGLSGLSSKPGQ